MTAADLANPTLVTFAKLISTNFWTRIKFARSVKGRLRVSETSLTEELVYQFYMMAANKVLPVKIFQSTNEKVNGSDLEILLELDGGVVKLPCQAKIIYATRRYGALYHEVGNQLQIDLLIRHAKRIGGYPIYMFYNYDEYITPKLLKVTGGVEHFWGCSIGSADEIKQKFFNKRTTPPMFRDMHPGVCWPFYKLFEFLNTTEAGGTIASIFKNFEVSSLKKYGINEILDDTTFEDLTSPEALGFVDHFEKFPYKIDDRSLIRERTEFNPRFRILITKDNLNIGSLTFLD
jgi:hypothetical protein